MAQIILDFGSGNTCKNNWNYVKRMIDELKVVDTGKHEVIIKWQLFKKVGDNIPLDREIFWKAYDYAASLGCKTTSSVFDKKSLDFLLQFNVPFIKIANRRDLDWLIGEIPRKIPVYVSHGKIKEITRYYFYDTRENITPMLCVSKYPARLTDYGNESNVLKNTGICTNDLLYDFSMSKISDHTTNWDLFNKFNPKIIEVHYKLDDSTGLDAGPFARTPTQLAEVL